MLQSKAVWNHGPFFDYVDRWMKGSVSGSPDTSSAFVSEMWTLYREKLPTGSPATPICDPAAEAGVPDAGADGGNGAAPGGPESGAAGADGEAASESGCGCRTASLQAGSVAWLFLVGAAAMIARRRRASR